MFITSNCAQGVNADLTHLFENYRHLLVGFVTRYTRCHDDAEDAVQTAFMQALSSGAQPQQASLSRSMFGTALLLARDAAQHRAQERDARPRDDATAQEPRDQLDPFDLIALHQIKDKVEASLRAFPQPVRETFDLVVNGETSYLDAAEHLGISLSTVQTHMAHVTDMVRSLVRSQ
jgi:RNA polymerase sigma-70 factor (ECF subfamily)